MNKILDKIKHYYQKRSKWSIFFDLLFYVFILLLLIPDTRIPMVSFLKKLTLTAPIKIKTPAGAKVSEADYQWPFQTMSGESKSLEDMKGDVVFLNFWATWCPPCIAEMSGIQRFYEEYGDKVKFILISTEEPEVLQTFLEKKQYTFPVYIQNYQTPEIFRSNSIPTSFIISGDGDIVMKKKGAAKWDSKKIKNLFDNLLDSMD